MRSLHSLTLYLVFCLAGLVSGCGDGLGPNVPGSRIVSGADVTDTIEAELTRPLIIEVHDSTGARVPPGTLVRFTGVGVSLSGLGGGSFMDLVAGTTDASGRSGAYIRLGRFAGPAQVVITVPTFGFETTASYTIQPGEPTDLAFTPTDRAMYVGRSFTLKATLVDRNGNASAEPVTFSSSSNSLSVTSAGLVTASKIGRYSITGSGGGHSAQAMVSVVPEGRLVGWYDDAVRPRMVAADLDASNVRDITSVAQGNRSHPMWIPGTSTIIYTAFGFNREELKLADDAQDQRLRNFLTALPSSIGEQGEATPTADGHWVYFSAVDTRCGTALRCLFRALPDGSGIQLLGNLIGSNVLSWRPAPSPDGSKVAFVTSSNGEAIIKVLDVAAGTVSSWSVRGQNPSWSPDGSSIAYTSIEAGPLWIINADGTNQRILTSEPRDYPETLLSWTSDSKWILASTMSLVSYPTPVNLIEVGTGLQLPLAQFSQLAVVSLKP